jgi:hypothetical protein
MLPAMGQPHQRTGLMVVTAWVEDGPEPRLTARIRRVIDVAGAQERQLESAVASAELIKSTVEQWLAELMSFDQPAPEGDAAVTKS